MDGETRALPTSAESELERNFLNAAFAAQAPGWVALGSLTGLVSLTSAVLNGAVALAANWLPGSIDNVWSLAYLMALVLVSSVAEALPVGAALYVAAVALRGRTVWDAARAWLAVIFLLPLAGFLPRFVIAAVSHPERVQAEQARGIVVAAFAAFAAALPVVWCVVTWQLTARPMRRATAWRQIGIGVLVCLVAAWTLPKTLLVPALAAVVVGVTGAVLVRLAYAARGTGLWVILVRWPYRPSHPPSTASAPAHSWTSLAWAVPSSPFSPSSPSPAPQTASPPSRPTTPPATPSLRDGGVGRTLSR